MPLDRAASPRELGVLVSVDTYKPAVARGRGRRRRGDRQRRLRAARPGLADVCARTGAALVVMHTRVAPKGTLLDPDLYDDVVADVRGVPRRAHGGRARARRAPRSRSCSTRGRTSPRRRRRPSRCCARLDELHALGRPLLLRRLAQGLRRRDHGPRAARARRRRRSPRWAGAPTRARTSCASTTSPRRPTSSPCARCCAASAVLAPRDDGLTPDRYPDGSRPRPRGALACRATGRRPLRTTRPGADRPSPTEGGPHVLRARRARAGSSPLADLHVLANELGVDGFRRLRKAELIDAIIARQGGEDDGVDAGGRRGATTPDARRAAPRRDGRRRRPPPRRTPSRAPTGAASGRRPTPAPPASARRRAAEEADEATTPTTTPTTTSARRARPPPRPARRGGRGPRPRATAAADGDRAPRSRATRRRGRRRAARATARASCASRRPSPPTTTSTSPPRRSSAASSSPATASAARCARPRRSERYPSLVRVDTINGRPADEVAEGTPLRGPARSPSRPSASRSAARTRRSRRSSGSRRSASGSRVDVAGAPAGRQDRGAARALAAALAGARGRSRSAVVLAGVAPGGGRRVEADGPVAPGRGATLRRVARRAGPGRRAGRRAGPSASPPAAATPSCVDRLARARCRPPAARRALAARAQHRRRRLADRHRRRAAAPLGGETTVIALDAGADRAAPLPGARPRRAAARCGRSCWSATRRGGDRQGAARTQRWRADAAVSRAACRRPGPSWARARARSARRRARAGRRRRCASPRRRRRRARPP